MRAMHFDGLPDRHRPLFELLTSAAAGAPSLPIDLRSLLKALDMVELGEEN